MSRLKGHRIEPGTTISLWRFNDPSGSYEYAFDENNKASLVLSQSTIGDTPSIVADGTEQVGRYARYFDSSNDNMAVPMGVGTNASDVSGVLTGSHTVECWIYPRSLANNRTIISVGGDGEGVSSNYVLWWYINSAGNQVSFWERGGGTNETHTQAVGSTIQTDQWQHVALSHEVDGTDRVVRWYLNGTLQDFSTGTNSDGDLTVAGAEICVGEEQTDGADFFHGAMSDLRISDVVRTDAQISASAADPEMQHSNDADTFLLWRFNEPPAAVDENGRFPLSPQSLTAQPESSFPLIRDGGSSYYFDGSPRNFVHPSNPSLAALFSGSFTLEWWGLIDSDNSSQKGPIFYGGAGGEAEEANFLWEMAFNTIRQITFLWETGLGTNVIGTSTTASYTVEEQRQIFHMAIVKEVSEVDGTVSILSYFNGELRDNSLTGSTNATGGTSVDAQLKVGSSDTDEWVGYIDDMRLSNRVKTQDEIRQAYLDGVDVPFRTYPITQRERP